MFGDRVFKKECVEQFIAERNSIVMEICGATGTGKLSDVRADLLNKRTISKEAVCQWLGSLCGLLDTVSVSVVEPASHLSADISKLKDEKISDSARIIELQQKLIEKQEEGSAKIVELQKKLIVKNEEDLGAVKTVVQSEMKTYSSFFKNTCNNAFAPRKLQAAVKRASQAEDRSKNLIVFGTEEEDLDKAVEAVFENLNEKPAVIVCCRVGREDTEGIRPTKVTLRSSDSVQQILRKTKLLKEVSGYEEIYVSPDRSPSERVAYKKLVESLKLKRQQDPSKVHFIRNNEVLTRDRTEEE